MLRFAHLPEPTFEGTAAVDDDEIGDGAEEYAELAPGVLYRFTLELNNLGGGDGRMLVQGETIPRDRLAQLPLSPAGGGRRGRPCRHGADQGANPAHGAWHRRARGPPRAHAPGRLRRIPLDKLATRETQPALEAARVTSLFAFVLRLAGLRHREA